MSTRLRMLRLVAVLAIVAVAALGGMAAARQRRAARLVSERLITLANHAGIALELGPSSWRPFGIVIGESKLSLPADDSVRGEIARIELDGLLSAPTHATLRAVHLHMKGEPSHLFEVVRKWWDADWANVLRVEGLEVEYEHPLVGRISWRDLSMPTLGEGSELALRAGRVSVAGETFANVSYAVARRGDFLEVGLGAASLREAKVKLSQYVPRGGGTRWVFSIVYQPLSELLGRLGWWGGPEVEATGVVGSVTLGKEPDEPRTKGYLSLTFDRWPGPDWPEANAFLGRTGAMYARIEADEPWRFDLPYVEITLPLFRVTGPGRLTPLGTGALARFEVAGRAICRVLAAHAAPSVYRDALVAFMDAHPEAASVDRAESPFVELRAQLDAARGLPSRASLAIEVSGGCGLDARSSSPFASLSLPAFVPPPSRSAP